MPPAVPTVRRSTSASTLTTPREQADRSKKARLQDVNRIRVVVRNRPLSRKEIDGQMGSILEVPEAPVDEGEPASVVVHEPKLKVDMTAYTEQHRFLFDAVSASL
jgi:kinesin family member 2/24